VPTNIKVNFNVATCISSAGEKSILLMCKKINCIIDKIYGNENSINVVEI
jgi:hypothetical protein